MICDLSSVSFCQVTLYHLLKLFQSDSSAMPKKTVVSEFYDEMVCPPHVVPLINILTAPYICKVLNIIVCFLLHTSGLIHPLTPLSSNKAFLFLSLSLLCGLWTVCFLYHAQIFQDPTAMMQQLLTTSRQLTLGAYKHETECTYSHGEKPGWSAAFTEFIHSGYVNKSD